MDFYLPDRVLKLRRVRSWYEHSNATFTEVIPSRRGSYGMNESVEVVTRTAPPQLRNQVLEGTCRIPLLGPVSLIPAALSPLRNDYKGFESPLSFEVKSSAGPNDPIGHKNVFLVSVRSRIKFPPESFPKILYFSSIYLLDLHSDRFCFV